MHFSRVESRQASKKAEAADDGLDGLERAFRAYVGAGLPPGRFWKITPRLALSEIEAHAATLNRAHDLAAFTAWHAAYLGRTKEPIPMADMMVGKSAKKSEPAEFLASRLDKSVAGLAVVSMASYLASKRKG